MTTIAFKDGILVADTQVTEGNWACGTAVKIHQVGRMLVGFSGCISAGQRFLTWVKEGLVGDSPADTESEAFVIEPCGRLTVWNGKHPISMTHVNGEYYATGSGKQFAIGAMSAGATAEEAVLHAAYQDVYTNDQLTVLTL
jgi:ATP-dependent HslUV protease subunit HslV